MVDFSITTESLRTQGDPPIEDSTWYGLGAVPPAWQKGFDRSHTHTHYHTMPVDTVVSVNAVARCIYYIHT